MSKKTKEKRQRITTEDIENNKFSTPPAKRNNTGGSGRVSEPRTGGSGRVSEPPKMNVQDLTFDEDDEESLGGKLCE